MRSLPLAMRAMSSRSSMRRESWPDLALDHLAAPGEPRGRPYPSCRAGPRRCGSARAGCAARARASRGIRPCAARPRAACPPSSLRSWMSEITEIHAEPSRVGEKRLRTQRVAHAGIGDEPLVLHMLSGEHAVDVGADGVEVVAADDLGDRAPDHLLRRACRATPRSGGSPRRSAGRGCRARPRPACCRRPAGAARAPPRARPRIPCARGCRRSPPPSRSARRRHRASARRRSGSSAAPGRGKRARRSYSTRSPASSRSMYGRSSRTPSSPMIAAIGRPTISSGVHACPAREHAVHPDVVELGGHAHHGRRHGVGDEAQLLALQPQRLGGARLLRDIDGHRADEHAAGRVAHRELGAVQLPLAEGELVRGGRVGLQHMAVVLAYLARGVGRQELEVALARPVARAPAAAWPALFM